MEILTQYRDGTLVLALPEEFCQQEARCVLGPLALLLRSVRVTSITVDMTATLFVNAEGLTVLRALADLAADAAVRVTAVVPNVHLFRLLHVLDLDQGMELAGQRDAGAG